MLNWAPHWLLPPLSCCSMSEWQPGGTSSPSWRLSEPSLAASGRRLMWPTCINHNFSSSHITHSKRRKVKRIVIGKMVSLQHTYTSMRQCFKNLNKIIYVLFLILVSASSVHFTLRAHLNSGELNSRCSKATGSWWLRYRTPQIWFISPAQVKAEWPIAPLILNSISDIRSSGPRVIYLYLYSYSYLYYAVGHILVEGWEILGTWQVYESKEDKTSSPHGHLGH